MKYVDFNGIKLSRLGFGAMRLPVNCDNSINEEEVFKMVDYAMNNGINYFDTAFPYHKGYSEIILAKALKRYDREKYYLATKFPGHQIAPSYDPKEIFEEQLKKCNVDYFDFYLLHNVYERSINIYLDEKWGIIDYFIEQKRLGRIKYLGFSTHANIDTFKLFLDKTKGVFDFCQIQLNYLDYDLQNAKEKVEILNKLNIPIFVMEPLRGGKLVNVNYDNLNTLRPIDYAFRFIDSIKGVKVILSGMSNMEQLVDNVNIFNNIKELSTDEFNKLINIGHQLNNTINCTSCKYCMEACPIPLNIPHFINTYNEVKYIASINAVLSIYALQDKDKPSSCLGCRKCEQVCPQSIKISDIISKLNSIMEDIPSWDKVSNDRLLEADKIRKEMNKK